MKEEWLFRGALVPIDAATTAALVAEIKRLIDVVGGMALAQQEGMEAGRLAERKRLEQAVEELAPVRDNPILQNKPAAFWIENFKQIVRGNK